MNKLDELYFGKEKRQHVKEFGALLCIISCIITGIIFYKHGITCTSIISISIGLFILLIAYTATAIFLPLWEVWMKFAHYLGMVMTNVILTIAWIVVMVPIAILLKVMGKKVIDSRFDRSLKTYWEDRDDKSNDFQLLERQF